MSSSLLLIRHAKRSGETSINLAGQDLKELVKELLGLGSGLEILDLSNNKIIALDGIDALNNLKELNLKKNQVKRLPKEITKCTKLKYLILEGNPIVDEYPYLKELKNGAIAGALEKYFGELEYEEETTESPEKASEEVKEDLSKLSVDKMKKIIVDLQTELKAIKADASKTKAAPKPAGKESQSDIENNLDIERSKSKKYEAQIDSLTSQLLKVRNEKPFGAGMTLESVQGITEIDYSELKIEEEIGKGGFATIYKGQWRGTKVAIKRLFDPNVTEAQMEEVRNEIVMMGLLRHPNITLLMGICRKPPNICIVMEQGKTSLFSLLHKTTVELALPLRLKMARDVAGAYYFMHSGGIVHRDLKSHNILLFESNQVKLCDFGLAKYSADLNKGAMQYSGTPAYMAPELFQKKSYDEKIDVFAFGTLLWELVSRQVPYEGLEPDMIKKKLLSPASLPLPYNCPKEVGEIITLCRSIAPEKRPSFKEVFDALDKIAH